jgi:hypothetical protein
VRAPVMIFALIPQRGPDLLGKALSTQGVFRRNFESPSDGPILKKDSEVL